MKLLFVTPTPPDRTDRDGMTQVAHAVISELGRRHHIDVWTIDTKPDQPNIPGAASVRVFPVFPRSVFSYYRSGSALPFFQYRFESGELHHSLSTLSADEYDIVILHSPFVAQYLADVRGEAVVHVLDSLSAWFTQVAQRAPWPKKLHLRWEAKKAAAMEQRLRAQALIVVSQDDAESLRKHVPEANIVVLPIGLEEAILNNRDTQRLPATVVMTGIMDYPPNIDAALFFSRHVWPRIRETFPDAEFRIVGKRPTRDVQQLTHHSGITVTGEVPSVLEELRRATIAVSPLRYGTGYKIKINEALASGAPLITSPASLQGTDVVPGRMCLIADTPEEWIASVSELLRSPSRRQQLGNAGRDFMSQRTWPLMARQYESVYTAVCEA